LENPRHLVLVLLATRVLWVAEHHLVDLPLESLRFPALPQHSVNLLRQEQHLPLVDLLLESLQRQEQHLLSDNLQRQEQHLHLDNLQRRGQHLHLDNLQRQGQRLLSDKLLRQEQRLRSGNLQCRGKLPHSAKQVDWVRAVHYPNQLLDRVALANHRNLVQPLHRSGSRHKRLKRPPLAKHNQLLKSLASVNSLRLHNLQIYSASLHSLLEVHLKLRRPMRSPHPLAKGHPHRRRTRSPPLSCRRQPQEHLQASLHQHNHPSADLRSELAHRPLRQPSQVFIP
jgi:hypothetical protein